MNEAPNLIQLVAFDADDTLWHSEHYYQETGERFTRIVSRYCDLPPEALKSALYSAEVKNLSLFGYGVKGLTLSMLETAVQITNSTIDGKGVEEILAMGKELLNHPVELLPGVKEVLDELSSSYQLALITKGDLFHQETKIALSKLSDYFSRVEIVSEKDVPTYERFLKSVDTRSNRFVMIGNSLPSDIDPVIKLGGWGIHIPYGVTWLHETRAVETSHSERLRVLSSVAEVPLVLREIEEQIRVSESAFGALPSISSGQVQGR